MTNQANCNTCKYKYMKGSKQEQFGHCYMFRHEPSETCTQHEVSSLTELAKELPDFRTAILDLNRRLK